jgi:hypothetical protein
MEKLINNENNTKSKQKNQQIIQINEYFLQKTFCLPFFLPPYLHMLKISHVFRVQSTPNRPFSYNEPKNTHVKITLHVVTIKPKGFQFFCPHKKLLEQL